MNQLGEIVFSQSFDGLECQAVVRQMMEDAVLLELRILQDGALVWSRLSEELPEDDWAFGCWEDGPGLPCLFDDLDGDGLPEMLAPVPKSDLSPTVYRVFAWNGKELVLLRRESLMADGSGEFVWSTPDPEQDTQITWVDSFAQGVAQVVRCRRATTSRQTMTLVPSRRGFVEAS